MRRTKKLVEKAKQAAVENSQKRAANENLQDAAENNPTGEFVFFHPEKLKETFPHLRKYDLNILLRLPGAFRDRQYMNGELVSGISIPKSVCLEIEKQKVQRN